ncbi:Transmembrane protein 14C [Savitreella phatthalungensis]
MAPAVTERDTFGLAYAGITLLGGIIGLVKAGSVPSLVASSICAFLIFLGTDRVSRDPKDVKFILGVSVLLTVFFAQRFRKSGKIMPGGIMAALSLAAVVRYSLRLL